MSKLYLEHIPATIKNIKGQIPFLKAKPCFYKSQKCKFRCSDTSCKLELDLWCNDFVSLGRQRLESTNRWGKETMLKNLAKLTPIEKLLLISLCNIQILLLRTGERIRSKPADYNLGIRYDRLQVDLEHKLMRFCGGELSKEPILTVEEILRGE